MHGDRRRVTNVRDETSNVASGQPIAQTVPPDQRVLVHDAVHPALTKRAQRRGASAPTDAIAVKPQVIFVRCGAERAREASSIIESSRTRARGRAVFALAASPSPSPRPPFARTSPRSTHARGTRRGQPRARERARAHAPSVALRSFLSLYVYASNLSSHFWRYFLRVSVASVGPSSP